MNIKFLLIFILFFFINLNIFADEIEIISDNIKILDNGDTIESTSTSAIIKKKKLYLEGKKSLYEKKKNLVTIIDDVIFLDNLKKIKIFTEEASYNQKKDTLVTKDYYNQKLRTNIILNQKM